MSFLCIHCMSRIAGFWVRRGGSAQRPWCLTCIDADLDRSTVEIVGMQAS